MLNKAMEEVFAASYMRGEYHVELFMPVHSHCEHDGYALLCHWFALVVKDHPCASSPSKTHHLGSETSDRCGL